MRYLKKYENDNQNIFWLVVVEFSDDPEANYQELYRDRESSDNCIIVKVNEFREESAERKGKKFTDDDMFLTINDALEWIDNSYNIRIYSYRIDCIDKFELPEKYKLIEDIRKYNI